MFVVSKIFNLFVLPSTVTALLAAAGIALLILRFRRLGTVALVASAVMLLAFGVSPLSNVLMSTLEDRFPPWDPAQGDPAGIVVLVGGIRQEYVSFHRGEDLASLAARDTPVAMLARRYPAARVVYSGGNGNLFNRAGTEAELALQIFLAMGIARDRISLEDRSRTTAENAEFTKALVQPQPGQRWLLVTAADHMPRAIGAFRHAGFPIEAYPVHRHTVPGRGWMHLSPSVPTGLARADEAMHEWGGLLGYWMTGRIATFFPEPEPSATPR